MLDSGLAGHKKVVVLQPRRVAARTVAARVAWERESQIGAEVGYQIRFEDFTSLGTRISFITEGILTRWLQDDAALNDVGVILFDEFHERNILSDVGLALVKRIQETTRPDLKLGVMSATLEAEPVAAYLGGCPVLISEGQSHPVQVKFLSHADDRPITEQAADLVESIVNSGEPGDILVFMPGMGEINATINACRAARTHESLALIPLHGELPAEEQDRAFAPNPLRKVVVSTNVAETSVTIDGILHVIDSGLARVARYDSERGINTLFLEPISRASSDQRRGRAGRTAPGVCHRLWTESNHLNRPEKNTPEIQRADLAEVTLLLHSLGIKRASEFDWLDRPDPAAIQRAERLLISLGALRPPAIGSGDEGASDITQIGRLMLRMPMHPRYSRMIIEASKHGIVPPAALCAALVSGRDILMRVGREDTRIKEARELFEASQDSDFYTLMRAFEFARKSNFAVEPCRRYGIHAQTARQVEQTWQQILDVAQKNRLWDSKAPAPAAQASPEQGDPLLRSIMTGFPDQLCRRRDQGTLECDLTEGRTGTLARESVVQNSKLFVAAVIREIESRARDGLTLLTLASAVKREWLEEIFPQHLTTRIEHVYDQTHKRVAAVQFVRFLDLTIEAAAAKDFDDAECGKCLAAAWSREKLTLPLLNHEVKQMIARVTLVAKSVPELGIEPLTPVRIQQIIAVALKGITLAKEAQAVPLVPVFKEQIGRDVMKYVEEAAPAAIRWPADKAYKLTYPELAEDGEPAPPELQFKLHECFSATSHPTICEGRVPVTLWLSAPDGKRLQSTTDWPRFKSVEYPKLRSALQKKYPGVAWL